MLWMTLHFSSSTWPVIVLDIVFLIWAVQRSPKSLAESLAPEGVCINNKEKYPRTFQSKNPSDAAPGRLLLWEHSSVPDPRASDSPLAAAAAQQIEPVFFDLDPLPI